MALISCYECSHQISSEAAMCPNCGAKPKTKKPQKKSPPPITSIVFISLFAMVVIYLFGDMYKTKRIEEERERLFVERQQQKELYRKLCVQSGGRWNVNECEFFK